jgi:hypothetical protein
VLSGLPPLVRDGDQFSAMLTLRNTTARENEDARHARGNRQCGRGACRLGSSAAARRYRNRASPQEIAIAAGGAKK